MVHTKKRNQAPRYCGKASIGDRIAPKRVVILDSIHSQNYRGRLSSDEAFAFKLETAAERKIGVDEKFLKGLEYYPSGIVVDGLSLCAYGVERDLPCLPK
ncbi:hypothetical protein K1719_042416 [Acacia pycnantha]|nr:hypothetical protein K1719_042416 [Acacia pycnantha]